MIDDKREDICARIKIAQFFNNFFSASLGNEPVVNYCDAQISLNGIKIFILIINIIGQKNFTKTIFNVPYKTIYKIHQHYSYILFLHRLAIFKHYGGS